jgi:hypothetical protein
LGTVSINCLDFACTLVCIEVIVPLLRSLSDSLDGEQA